MFEDEQGKSEIWEVRRSTIEYTRIPGEHAGLAGWEDAAVAPERLGDYIRDYCALVARHGYHTVMFGHFGPLPRLLASPMFPSDPCGAEVLHVDSDYDMIARVTGQPMRRLFDPGPT